MAFIPQLVEAPFLNMNLIKQIKEKSKNIGHTIVVIRRKITLSKS